MMTTEPDLTVREVAQRMSVSPDTIKKAIKNGLLPHYRIGARGDLRVTEEALRAWIAAGAPTTQPKGGN